MRIMAMSDQHGMLDRDVPPCDLLIIAGDNCPDSIGRVYARHDPLEQYSWFQRTYLAWVHRQPAKNVIITWGNHDYCGTLGNRFGRLESVIKLRGFGPMANYPLSNNVWIVADGLIEIEGLKIWMSPWSKTFFDWAFMKPDHDLLAHLARVPEGIDILVSHDPPRGYGDTGVDQDSGRIGHFGSTAVLKTVERVKPKVVISGHFHDGFGIKHMDICEKHGSAAEGCECHTFHSVTIYNVAQAGGAMSQGTIYLPESRGPVEILL